MKAGSSKTPKQNTSLPFPFLGQGEAEYFEWFEMWIWFAAPVAEKARRSLLASGPATCVRDTQWPKPELLWSSSGDQAIQRHLIETYGTPAAKKRFAEASARAKAGKNDDDTLDALIAGPEQKTFNTAIERWLLEMHASCPILFVVRGQDSEAGGTKLGKWHAASVEAFADRLQPTFEALTKLKLGKSDGRRTPITLALNYVGPDRFPKAIRDLANSHQLVTADAVEAQTEDEALQAVDVAFLEKKFARAAKLAKELDSADLRLRALMSVASEVSCWNVDLATPAVHTLMLSLMDGLAARKLSAVLALPLVRKKASPHMVGAAYAGVLEAAAWANDRKTFDSVARLVDKTPKPVRGFVLESAVALAAARPVFAAEMRKLVGGGTAAEFHELACAAEVHPAQSLALYEAALAQPKPRWESVCNGIAMFLRTHPKKLPADMAEVWLARGLAIKRGPVHRNVACLLVRLGRLDQALEHAVLALERGVSHEDMSTDADLKPIRRRPAFVAALRHA